MRKHYHFIGIGGVGMSGLAHILLSKGEKVTGSDLRASPIVDHLAQKGAGITLGHAEELPAKPDAVIYSTDIPTENSEYLAAKALKIPILHRSELLAQVMSGDTPILVTGTHGKTTTSSMLAHLLVAANFDPSYAIGGYFDGVGSNGRFGKGMYFVAEADESDGSFVRYPSFGAIITNLEHDHMDFWKSEQALLKGYEKFASQVASKEHLFWCYDDPLLRSLELKGHSFGFDEKADLCIENFQQIGWKTTFDLHFKRRHYRGIEISLIGAHNVLNAAATFGMGLKLDVSEEMLRSALKKFRGVDRRLAKVGAVGDVDIYDDYAHHPTEIFSTLRALKCAMHGRRLVVAFQPHRYSRTEYCLDDFADAFIYANEVIVTDIYAAGEAPHPHICSEKIIKEMKAGGFSAAQFVSRKELPKFLKGFLRSGDVLVTMGAGDITHVGRAIVEAEPG